MAVKEPKTVSERALSLVSPRDVATGSTIMLGDKQVTLKKRVTRPLLKGGDHPLVYIRIDTAITRELDANGEPVIVNRMPSPWVAGVTDLTDDVEKDFIFPAVLARAIKRDYPDTSYIGKSFAVNRVAKEEGKRYYTFDIAEIEVA